MLNVLLNLALFTVKFIGGKISNSVSVISDAFNNLTDAVTTMFAWFGLKISSVGAGEQHPNGHGRFEWVIALLSASSVIVISWELLWDSISAIKNPQETVMGIFTAVVLALSVAVKFFMYLYNKKKSRDKNSASLQAVAVDCLSDAVSTAVVLVSLIINALFAINIDGWCGILVSLFIMYNAFGSFTDTLERVMGHAASKEQLAEMYEFASENADFKEIYDLQIEDYGFGRYKVSMTVVGKEDVDAETLLAGITNLKYRIFEKYGYNAQISVEKNCEESKMLGEYVENVLKTINVPLKILSMRETLAKDFRLVTLELGVDFIDDHKKEELESKLRDEFNQISGDFKFLMKVRLMPTRRGESEHHRNRNHSR